jgi:hypothetical protein
MVAAIAIKATEGISNQIKPLCHKKFTAVKIKHQKNKSKQIDYGETLG